MRVLALRHALAVFAERRDRVALDDRDAGEVVGENTDREQPAHAGADHDGVFSNAASEHSLVS
jgi:hypothetical protein